MTFKNNKTKKSTSKKYRCYVKPVKAPVEEKLALADVKQVASNAVNLTFTTDASKTVTKDNLTIKSTDGSVELAINTIAFSADGKSAKVTVFGNFTNATQYNVSYDSVDKAFTASVGAVTTITVDTASAEQNVETPIKFTLTDAQGIDVTPAINLDSHVTVDVTGSYYTLENSLASKAKITMNNIGDVADVTVTYSSNQAGVENVVGTGKITCVSATAKVGTTMFVSAKDKDINNKSKCAKFYQGLKDERVTVAVNEENKNVFFCATDKSGDVISYDSYAVESANDNIAAAVTMEGQATGKYVRILVSGSNVGSTQLNITATKNGVDSFYTIPVTVVKTDAATRINVTQDRTEMSTVDETGYDCTVTATLFDANDRKVLSSFECELLTEVPQGETKPEISTAGYNWDKTEASFDITFRNAYAREDVWTTYTFRITGVDENHKDTKFTRNITVRVKKLPENLTNDLEYQIELTVGGKVSTVVEEIDTTKRNIIGKLYANYNSLFAGYVKAESVSGSAACTTSRGAIAGGDIPTQSAIVGISGSALRGVDIYTVTGSALKGNLMERKTSGMTKQGDNLVTATAGNLCSMEFTSVDGTLDGSDAKIIDTKNEAAEVGNNYYMTFTYALASGKIVTKSSGFKVTRDYKTPTAKVSTTTVNRVSSGSAIEDFDNIIKTAITTNVDMNNNNSGYESITMNGQGLYKKATSKSGQTNLVDLYTKLEGADIHNNRIVVGYVQVVDNIGDENWYFYAPVNATFKQI